MTVNFRGRFHVLGELRAGEPDRGLKLQKPVQEVLHAAEPSPSFEVTVDVVCHPPQVDGMQGPRKIEGRLSFRVRSHLPTTEPERRREIQRILEETFWPE